MSYSSLVSYKKSKIISLLAVGIMLFCFGLWLLYDGFAIKTNLYGVKGKLQSADMYVTSVRDRGGHESNKAELIFYLEGINKKFHLWRNIGDEPIDKEYSSIKKGLEMADTISVWIREREMNDLMPKVFQIDGDETSLLDYETVRGENSALITFLLIGGLVLITISLRIITPVWFKKTFGI